LAQILWLMLAAGTALEEEGGVLRIFVGCHGNTGFSRPIQHQHNT
jgi:hypothetical protein